MVSNHWELPRLSKFEIVCLEGMEERETSGATLTALRREVEKIEGDRSQRRRDAVQALDLDFNQVVPIPYPPSN